MTETISRRTVAVLLAGGTGQRMGLETPKQLLRVAGKPILEHTIDVFQNCAAIDSIVIAMATGYLQEARLIARNYSKVHAVVEGGATRNETTRAAIDTVDDDGCNVLIHDAVRPLVGDAILQRCVQALDTAEAIDVVIPSADTIVEVHDDVLARIPDRNVLRRGQTPQGFRLSTLKQAYASAEQVGDLGNSDDCTLVMRYLPEVPIVAVEGSEENIKITRPLDAFIADKLFQLSTVTPEPAPEAAHRESMAGKSLVIFGGTSGIGAAMRDLATAAGASVFSYGRSATGTDITQPDDVTAALEQAYLSAGKIDYVVNTAGLLTRGAVADLSAIEIAEATNVNYVAPILLAKSALPYLRESRGQLLLFTSSSYTRGRRGYALYSSAKSAVVNLSQALADEWSDYDVRVNCINPERTGTPMRRAAFGEEDESTMLTAEDVAHVSLRALASVASGQVFDVRWALR